MLHLALFLAAVFPTQTQKAPATFRTLICGKRTCEPCPELRIERVLYGHFVSAQSEDALVATSGCEPHAMDFGGAVLLTRSGADWQKLWYEPGLIVSDCMKQARSGGREVPVCFGGHRAQDEISQVLYTVNIERKEIERVLAVVTAEQSCGRIDRVTFDNKGADVLVTYGKGKCRATTTNLYRLRFMWNGNMLTPDEASKSNFRKVNAEF